MRVTASKYMKNVMISYFSIHTLMRQFNWPFVRIHQSYVTNLVAISSHQLNCARHLAIILTNHQTVLMVIIKLELNTKSFHGSLIPLRMKQL